MTLTFGAYDSAAERQPHLDAGNYQHTRGISARNPEYGSPLTSHSRHS